MKIVRNINIKSGEPVISGTRITIKSVLQYLSSGISVSELSNKYNKAGVSISKKDINSIIAYASHQIGKIHG